LRKLHLGRHAIAYARPARPDLVQNVVVQPPVQERPVVVLDAHNEGDNPGMTKATPGYREHAICASSRPADEVADEVAMQLVAEHGAPSTVLHPSPLSPPACVAVAGAGGFGQFCLEAYRQTDDISVAAVADPNLAGSAPRTHPELSITADWRKLLDVPTIEVIHLATPPLLRAEIAVPALKAGKSVFCEKPLALSLREADEILDAARLAGRSVGVDYVLRHHPAFELVARLAASGLFGQLRTFSLQNFAQALPGDHWMWDT